MGAVTITIAFFRDASFHLLDLQRPFEQPKLAFTAYLSEQTNTARKRRTRNMTNNLSFKRLVRWLPRLCQMVLLLALVNGVATIETAPPVQAKDTQTLKMVAFGDSLTAGFGLEDAQSFPAQLEDALKARGHDVEVLNAGVSGDTTAAGLQRFDWAIPDDADAVILELGANDALRGFDPAIPRRNLDAILAKLKARNLPVLLAGMSAPRNLGQTYIDKFDPIYDDLAAKHDVLLYPFFLDGVALDPALNLPDGLHPNAKGINVIVERILPSVEELIAAARQSVTATPKM